MEIQHYESFTPNLHATIGLHKQNTPIRPGGIRPHTM